VDREGFSEYLAHRHLRIERVKRILEDNLDATTKLLPVVFAERRNRRSVEEEVSPGRIVQPHEDLKERRLPTSALSDYALYLTFFETEIDAVYGPDPWPFPTQ